MMAMISPALESMVETLSTVKFASRAKNIKNQPIVIEDFDHKVRESLLIYYQALFIRRIHLEGSVEDALLNPSEQLYT